MIQSEQQQQQQPDRTHKEEEGNEGSGPAAASQTRWEMTWNCPRGCRFPRGRESDPQPGTSLALQPADSRGDQASSIRPPQGGLFGRAPSSLRRPDGSLLVADRLSVREAQRHSSGPLVQVLPAHTGAESPRTCWPISGLKDVLMNNKSTTAVHF